MGFFFNALNLNFLKISFQQVGNFQLYRDYRDLPVILEISGNSRNLTSTNKTFSLDQYITVQCLQNGLKITVELNKLQQKIKTNVCHTDIYFLKKKSQRDGKAEEEEM